MAAQAASIDPVGRQDQPSGIGLAEPEGLTA